MADAIKSALFVDYDSVHRSLRGARRDAAAARLAERSSAWIAAIEAGKLFAAGMIGLAGYSFAVAMPIPVSSAAIATR